MLVQECVATRTCDVSEKESVCVHGKSLCSLGMTPYQIHPILLLLVIRHPNSVSLYVEESVKVCEYI